MTLEVINGVSYAQVAEALRLGWAWFYVTTKREDDIDHVLLVHPTRVTTRHFSSEDGRQFFEFEAEDEEGMTYTFTVFVTEAEASELLETVGCHA